MRVGLTALAMGLGSLLGSCIRGESAPWERVERIALGSRITTGRLARQVAWEPCLAIVDSSGRDSVVVPRVACGRLPTPGTSEFAREATIAADVGRRRQADSSIAALGAVARFDLRWSSAAPGALDRAVDALERVARAMPRDAAALNDLAVAQLAVAEREQTLPPMLRALDAVERALVAQPGFAPALFNRALVLDRLYLTASARRAWTRYLAVDRSSGWGREAAAHLARLDAARPPDAATLPLDSLERLDDVALRAAVRAHVRRSPPAARDLCFATLGRWGEAVRRDDGARGTRLLAVARALAAALDSLAPRGDRSAVHAVAAVIAAGVDARRTRALAAAHAAFSEGLRAFGQAAYEDAARHLAAAERGLRLTHSPAARWAGYYHAAARISRGDFAGGDQRLTRVLAEATEDEPVVAGKALLALGVSQIRRGNYEPAARHYQAAAPIVARAGEPEQDGYTAYLLADALALAGQYGPSDAQAYRALRLLAPFRRSSYLNNHLALVAAEARRERLPLATLAIMDEGLDVARGVGNAQLLALALRLRARDLAVAGRAAAADSSLAEGDRWAARMAPGRGRDRVTAALLLARGQLRRARDPRGALSLLAGAADAYRSFRGDLFLPTALYEAALAARAAGQPTRARAWLTEAIAFLERQRSTFQSTEVQVSLYETSENLFDAMIDMELARGRDDLAFEYLERGRVGSWAGAVRGAVRGAVAPPATLAGVARQLPNGVALVEYALLPERTLAWTVTRGRWRLDTLPVGRDTIAALTERLDRELDTPEVGTGDARARLYDLLLRPLAASLGRAHHLAIVPDRELHRVPFAALWDRSTERYLIEERSLATLPSAAFLLAATSRRRAVGRESPALVIGSPTTSADAQLAALPGAEREAEGVARLYARSDLLIGHGASRDRMLARLATSALLHFAGHAIFNGVQPELSYLALARDSSRAGRTPDADRLTAREIGTLRLSNLQVVVLSACSTLNPRATRQGAVAGLAYSFLRAGAPATISTLWDVGDEATSELLLDFHRRLAGHAPPSEALRSAQLDALRSSGRALRAPRMWAAFTYTGP